MDEIVDPESEFNQPEAAFQDGDENPEGADAEMEPEPEQAEELQSPYEPTLEENPSNAVDASMELDAEPNEEPESSPEVGAQTMLEQVIDPESQLDQREQLINALEAVADANANADAQQAFDAGTQLDEPEETNYSPEAVAESNAEEVIDAETQLGESQDINSSPEAAAESNTNEEAETQLGESEQLDSPVKANSETAAEDAEMDESDNQFDPAVAKQLQSPEEPVSEVDSPNAFDASNQLDPLSADESQSPSKSIAESNVERVPDDEAQPQATFMEEPDAPQDAAPESTAEALNVSEAEANADQASHQEPEIPQKAASEYVAQNLKVIDVEVQVDSASPYRLIRVLLDYTQIERKPYLGGFRNKNTKAVYHHAYTQTPRQPKYANAKPGLSRETQTVKTTTRSGQTLREQATQMERPGVLMDETYDRLKTPGPYQTADERDIIVERATRTIQRYLRGWIGRKRAAYLRKKKIERDAFLRELEQKQHREAEEHQRKEIGRRLQPKTAKDFEILYNELEAWRLQETRKIKEAGLTPEKEQEVLQQLLHKETKLLQTIDRLKIHANHENKVLRVQKALNDMSKPKAIELKNGGKVDVHTPYTTRAKELMQLYNGLNLPMLTIDERLDVLLHVKWTVKEFDCHLTRELVGLIDREADLLNRGRSPRTLEGLRKRISSLFLDFIETPEFNPEAAKMQVIPKEAEKFTYEKLERAHARSQRVTAGSGNEKYL